MKRIVLSILFLFSANVLAVEFPNVKLVEPIKRDAAPGCNNPAADRWEELGLGGVIATETRSKMGNQILNEASKNALKKSTSAKETKSSGSRLPDYLTE